MEEVLREFGLVLGKLKNAYAEEYSCNKDSLDIHIDKDNYITIVNNLETGSYCYCFRDWIDTEGY